MFQLHSWTCFYIYELIIYFSQILLHLQKQNENYTSCGKHRSIDQIHLCLSMNAKCRCVLKCVCVRNQIPREHKSIRKVPHAFLMREKQINNPFWWGNLLMHYINWQPKIYNMLLMKIYPRYIYRRQRVQLQWIRTKPTSIV